MPLTIEQLAARQKAIAANKEALGLRNAGIDATAPITDVRSLYGSEPAAPGTQNPLTPAVPGTPAAPAPKPTIAEAAASIDVPDFTDPYQQFGDYYKTEFDTPIDEKAIRTSTRERFQSEIDAINQIYAQKLAESKVQGQNRSGISTAIQARGGRLGSDFGAAETETVNRYNTEINNSVLAEQQAKIQGILSQADKDASDEIAAKRLAKQQGADSYLAFLQGQTERKQAKVGGIIQTLFDKGIDPNTLDKATLQRITSSYGVDLGTLSAGYRELLAEKQAAEQDAMDKEIGRTKSLAEIDKLTTETQTGADKSRAETFLKLAEGRLKQLEVDNYGQPPRPGTKDYAEYQKLLAETDKVRKETDYVGKPTPSNVSTTVNQIASAFDNEPIVREYNTVKTTVQALANAGTSATDDIQRIYAFAKIMDPNSAVREGEYKTVQDYATALLQRTGINIQRAFDARGFLTEDARKNMQNTLENVLSTKKAAYDNVAQEYQRQIDDAYQGKDRKITDYSGGVTNDSQPSTGDPLDDALRKEGFSYGGSGPANAQKVLGKAQPSPIALAAARKYPVNSTGGQCTTFLHKIADFPSIGDGKKEKFASVDKIGIPKAQWQPKVGDIIVTGENETYGHTAMINAILPDGSLQLTESNYYSKSKPEKVTHDRKIAANSPQIYGAIRPKTKLKTTLA